jgi:hypothetical protein
MKKKIKYPQISNCQLEINALKKDIYRAEKEVELWKRDIKENFYYRVPGSYAKMRLQIAGKTLYKLGLDMRYLKTKKRIYIGLSNL